MVVTDPAVYAGFAASQQAANGTTVQIALGDHDLQTLLVRVSGDGFDQIPYLSSNTTRQVGLITDVDLQTYLKTGQGLQADFGQTDLAQNADLYHQVAELKGYVVGAFLAYAALCFLLTLAMLLHLWLKRPGRWPQRLTCAAWQLALSLIVGSLLMWLWVPPLASGAQLLSLWLGWALLVFLLSLVLERASCTHLGLGFLSALTVLVIALDLVCGGNLSRFGFFTYGIFRTYRYFGIDNELSASLFAALIIFSGWMLERQRILSRRSGQAQTEQQGKCRPSSYALINFPIVGLLLIMICALPGAGASYGPIIWALFALFWAWWLFCGWRVRWYVVLLSVVVPVALAVAVLALDLGFSGGSHLGNLASAMHQGLPALFEATFLQSMGQNLKFVLAALPLPVLIVYILVFLVLVYCRIWRFTGFWQVHRRFAASFAACLIMAGALMLVEDSGFYASVFALVFAFAALPFRVLERD
jgi:hypothetical protein